MSKLTRKNIKVFGGSSSNTGKFGSAAAGSGVLATDIETMQSLPAWDNGMASATIGGQKLLPQEEMEAMMRVATYGVANIYQDGIPVYDDATTYYIDSIVRQDNTTVLYKSLTDGNVGNVLTDTVNWQNLGDLSNLINIGADTVISLGTISSGTVTLTKDKMHTVTFSGASTIALPTSLTSGVHYNCSVLVTMSSVVTITQPTVTWAYGSSPSLTSTSVKYRLTYETIDGGTTWYGYWTQLGA